MHRYYFEVITYHLFKFRILPVQAVPGYFAHDDPSKLPLPPVCLILVSRYLLINVAFRQVPPRFGLNDESDDRWDSFLSKIQKLNDDAAPGTAYKFFLLTRHGQGYRA